MKSEGLCSSGGGKITFQTSGQQIVVVPPTGKICGSLLKAIDEFCMNKSYDFDFEQTKCPCGKCKGYGNGRNNFVINKKTYDGKEYPGMHRSLLFALKGLIFYLKKTKSDYSVREIYSGYRCWNNNEQKGRTSTNHMGCALDLHFNLNGSRTRNVKDMEYIRSNFFCKYMNAPRNSKSQIYGFGWIPDHIGMEAKLTNKRKPGATTWIHYDVREFKSYKSDVFFVTSKSELAEKKMIDLAKELGLQNMCNCQVYHKGMDVGMNISEICDICGLSKKDCNERFENAMMPIIFKHEGGYSDDKIDSGGKTNKGISWGTWQNFAKKDLGIEPTESNLKKLTKEQAISIYRIEYWDAHKLCKIKNSMVALMIFDWTITSGHSHEEVQKLLRDKYGKKIEIDNYIGMDTINAINSIPDQNRFLYDIARIRKQYYMRLTEWKPSNKRFLNGWYKRVDDCLNQKL